LDASGRWLGIGIAALVNIFNPTRVSLGGLFARIFPYVREVVLRELDLRVMPAPRAMVEVTTVSLGANAILLGAAELALAPTLYDPTIFPPIRRSGTLRIPPMPVVHISRVGAGISRPKEVEA
jgi:hypothetical protein